jgi:ferredoxin-NADP reductase/CRP-like cAMP-binding protein
MTVNKKIAPLYLWNHALLYLFNLKESFYHQVTPSEIELIQKTHLFDKLDPSFFKELCQQISMIKYLPEDLIFQEGDLGDALYIIASGSVRVFTQDAEGTKIALARLEQGDFFGEQALLDQAHKTRNASIEAISEVRLIKIPESFILKLFQIDHALKIRLRKLGYQQIIKNLIAFADAYEAITNDLMTQANRMQFFQAGDVIFSLGDEPEYVYFIASGSVELSFPALENIPATDIILHKGHLFGELAALQKKSRVATAVAKTPVYLIPMKMEVFTKIYQETPQLKSLVDALFRNYQLPKLGAVQQYLGKTFGADTITTIYHLHDERTVIATRVIGQDYFTMTAIEENKHPRHLSYEKTNLRKTELLLKNNFIVEIKNYGFWETLPKACQMLLNHENLSEKQLEYFETTGDFTPPKNDHLADRDQLVCECMSVSRGTLVDLINSGVHNFQELSAKTGCSTVCGCCKYTVLEMLGQSNWLSVKLTKLISHNPSIMSFCLTPLQGQFNPYQPGQHLVLQAKIDENWIERTYSISGEGSQGELYITVKKEAAGIFSRWLFEHAEEELIIKCTQPQGEFVTNFNDQRPLIYFAGGIGITPFISYVKKLVEQGHNKPMHLIYCAVKQDDFILLEELQQFSEKNAHFSFELRPTETLGSLKADDILRSQQKFSNAEIYICGPEGFEKFINETLIKNQIDAKDIHIERFTFAGSK